MLPIELVELIFSKVKDKKTILSLRLTNKHFYNMFKEVIDNENKKKYVFNEKSYQTFNLNSNILLEEIVFKFPCYYVYKEYMENKLVQKEIKSSLFEIEKTEFEIYRGFKKKIYNVYHDKTTETKITYPMLYNCTVM